jgi:hypothetical protein
VDEAFIAAAASSSTISSSSSSSVNSSGSPLKPSSGSSIKIESSAILKIRQLLFNWSESSGEQTAMPNQNITTEDTLAELQALREQVRYLEGSLKVKSSLVESLRENIDDMSGHLMTDRDEGPSLPSSSSPSSNSRWRIGKEERDAEVVAECAWSPIGKIQTLKMRLQTALDDLEVLRCLF